MMQFKLTPEQFKARLQQVEARVGQTLPTDTGRITHSGVTVEYGYNGALLTVNVRSKPFFLSEGFVENEITAWFAGS